MKKCKTCLKELELNNFWSMKDTPDKLSYNCKKCQNKINNKNIAIRKSRENSNLYYKNNKAKIAKRVNKVYKTNIIYRLTTAHRAWVKQLFERNYIKYPGKDYADSLLGVSIIEFKNYIESLWQSDMNWENHGKGISKWQLDHVSPLCLIDLTNKTQLKTSFNYKNIRPVWNKEHKNKSGQDRIICSNFRKRQLIYNNIYITELENFLSTEQIELAKKTALNKYADTAKNFKNNFLHKL